MNPYPGELEQLVLIAVLGLGEEGYGITIRREIEARSGRRVALSSLYTTLDRLEQKGWVRSWIGEPTAQRGGRRKKHYALEPAGGRALRRVYRTFRGMIAGLEGRLETL